MKDIVKAKMLKNNILALQLNRPCEIDEKKLYEVEFNEYKSKRSLEQNRYLWLLITEITKKENGGRATSEDLIITYCNLLEQANAKFDFLLIPNEAISEFKKRFRAVRLINHVKIKGVVYAQIQAFWGSSTMNTTEMSELIDTTLNYAYEVGVDDVANYWKEVLK